MQAQQPHGLVLGDVPSSAAAQNAPDLAHVVPPQQSVSQLHSQAQSISLQDSAEVQQLLSMSLQDQMMSYVAAMSGLKHAPQIPASRANSGAETVARAGPYPVLHGSQQQQTQTQMNVQLAEIQHRVLQAGPLLFLF